MNTYAAKCIIFAFEKCIKFKTMKKHLLLAVVVLLATIGAFAQVTETVTVVKDAEQGRKETVTFIERFIHDDLYDPLPDLYYSYLNMRSGAFGPEANVPLRSSSFEWGFYSMDQVYSTKNARFGITTGFGLSNSYNYFTHDVVLCQNDDKELYFQSLNAYSSIEGNGPVNNFAHRTFVRYWSLRLPVMFQLQWTRIDDNGNTVPLVIAVGAELEYRFGMRSFARYGGAKHHVIQDMNYQPFTANALFSIRGNNSTFFLRMGLDPMFNIKDVGDIYQMSFGFGFNID